MASIVSESDQNIPKFTYSWLRYHKWSIEFSHKICNLGSDNSRTPTSKQVKLFHSWIFWLFTCIIEAIFFQRGTEYQDVAECMNYYASTQSPGWQLATHIVCFRIQSSIVVSSGSRGSLVLWKQISKMIDTKGGRVDFVFLGLPLPRFRTCYWLLRE